MPTCAPFRSSYPAAHRPHTADHGSTASTGAGERSEILLSGFGGLSLSILIRLPYDLCKQPYSISRTHTEQGKPDPCSSSKRPAADQTPAWWFLDNLVVEHASLPRVDTVVLEMTLPAGSSAAAAHAQRRRRHVVRTRRRDTIRCGDDETTIGAGAWVSLPRGVPHTYRRDGRRTRTHPRRARQRQLPARLHPRSERAGRRLASLPPQPKFRVAKKGLRTQRGTRTHTGRPAARAQPIPTNTASHGGSLIRCVHHSSSDLSSSAIYINES